MQSLLALAVGSHKDPSVEITFLGGTGTVTGSKYLLTSKRTRILVDCGLFQGLKVLRLRNRQPLAVNLDELDAVVLTHAHIDHSGYLPVVVRNGFNGPVYCTPPTADLCDILLADSGYLQEEDARYANRKRFSKHEPALPLYTEDDGRRAAERLTAVDPCKKISIGDLTVELRPAGHILGAASVLVSDGSRSVLFSGDLGRSDDLLMHPPQAPGEPNCVLIESTYGDRDHADGDPVAALGEVVSRTTERGGTVLIPSFAVGRAQTLLLCLHRLFSTGAVKRVPVYLNSPMATDVTALYERHHAYHRLSEQDCAAMSSTAEMVRTIEESKQLNTRSGPMVIISASGMLTGGRVLHHLKSLAPSPGNTIVLPGYQAAGTRGAALAAGAEEVKIHGGYVPVRAEVVQFDMFSAHADRGDLLSWLGACERPPRSVFVVHGDPDASDALRLRIKEKLGFDASVPEHGQTIRLG